MKIELTDSEYELLNLVADEAPTADIEGHPDFHGCKAFGLLESYRCEPSMPPKWRRTLAGSAVALRHTASQVKHADPEVYNAAKSSLRTLAGMDDLVPVPRNLLVSIDSELSAVAHGRPQQDAGELSGRVRKLLRKTSEGVE